MPKQILIVDDDKELTAEITEILEGEGFDIDVACDGLKGAQMAKAAHYDVIFLDIKMPGINGIELLREIKQYNHTSKVFLVSGNPFLEKLAAQENLTGLIAGLISKPFDIEDLITRLKSA